MRIKMLGAALTGALMLGATLAGAASAAAVPPKSFFIDQASGSPNVVIAVGAQANASDVVSASLIAAAVGNMATIEETQTVRRTSSAEWGSVQPYNYTQTQWISTAAAGYPAMGANPPTPVFYNASFDLFSNGVWDTSDTGGVRSAGNNVSIAMPRAVVANDATFAKELNTLWYATSPRAWNLEPPDSSIYSVTASAGGITAGNVVQLVTSYYAAGPPEVGVSATLPPLDGTQTAVRTYGQILNRDGTIPNFEWNWNFFDGFSSVNVTGFAQNPCYFFGGTQSPMPPHEEIQLILTDETRRNNGPDGVYFRGSDALDRNNLNIESGIIYRTTEIRYPLREGGQNICGINWSWGMVDFETAVQQRLYEIKFLGNWYTPLFAGHNFFLHGTPKAQKEVIMKVGDVYEFHGWTVNLLDINIYENKAYINVKGPNHERTFLMVMDSIQNCTATCCPAQCGIYGGGGAFTSNPTGQSEFDPYVVRHRMRNFAPEPRLYDFWYTEFMLDGIKTFIGADGTYLAEFNIYALIDYGWLIAQDCCEPFVTTPNNYALEITGGWGQLETNSTIAVSQNADIIRTNTNNWNLSAFQRDTADFGYFGPGAFGVGPGYNATLIQWTPARPDASNRLANPNAMFDTLELRLCDEILIPDCDRTYTLPGPDNYFSIEISAQRGGNPIIPEFDDDVDLKVKISQTAVVDTVTYTRSVTIDPVELIKLDVEISTGTLTRNLLLVGGPVYNTIVKDLVDMGASEIDWFTSPGEWEWIDDPFGRGYDVLIVAGAAREETRFAAQQLVSLLR